jgi:hypothetical protein
MNAFQEGLARVSTGNWMGFIDKTGKVVIKGKYRDLEDFSNGLAAVRVGDRWGYLNQSGEMVIAPQYIVARAFESGRTLALDRGLWHLIDSTGTDLAEPMGNIRFLDGFKNGMAAGRDHKSSSFYLDSLGNRFSTLEGRPIEDLLPFRDGIGQVKVDGGWRLVDRSLQPLMTLNFLEPITFSEGMGRARFGMKYGLYGKGGEAILDVRFDHLKPMGTIVQVGDGNTFGYIRPDGSWIKR